MIPAEVVPAWMEQALCTQVDTEIFFPDMGGSTRSAKRICAMCPVKDDCLNFALNNGERFGIWGGTSERERRKLQPEPARGKGRPAQPIEHGTPGGHRAHYRAGEVPCRECAEANRIYRANRAHGARQARTPREPSRNELVREWAGRVGIRVAPKGRIAAQVYEQYDAAHRWTKKARGDAA